MHEVDTTKTEYTILGVADPEDDSRFSDHSGKNEIRGITLRYSFLSENFPEETSVPFYLLVFHTNLVRVSLI